MLIPFVLIDLTSVTGYVTDVSDIYTSSKDPIKTPMKGERRKLLVLFVSRHRTDDLLRH